jgi:hypothetical protein
LIYGVQEVGRGERYAHERPVIIRFTRIHLLTVHLTEFLFSEVIRQYLQNPLFLTFSGEHKSDIECRWNTKAENSINVDADNLQVHQSGKQFLETFGRRLMQLRCLLMECFFKNLALFLVVFPLLLVVVKDSGDEASLAEDLLDVVQLGSECNHTHHSVFPVLIVELGKFL